MDATEYDVDHINGDSLDNRRCNLRFVTHQQNLMNQAPQSGCSSKYKGVYLNKKLNSWVVQIKYRGRMRSITGIQNEKIADMIYDLLALDRFKEFAKFNFPEMVKEAWNKRADNGGREE